MSIITVDHIGLLYLVLFPVGSAVVGWALLSRTLRSGLAERWNLRSLSVWRYVVGYTLFVTTWLTLVAACILIFGRAAAVLSDHLLLIAAFSMLAWVASGIYWGILAWSAESVLGLPTMLARRTASNTLLWNLLLTLPYTFMAMPYVTRA